MDNTLEIKDVSVALLTHYNTYSRENRTQMEEEGKIDANGRFTVFH